MRVFINYRRSDSAAYAGRLFDNLRNALGSTAVFRDIDSIEVGTNFEGVIERSLADADAVIVVIGPTWLTAPDETGRARLEDERDYVRMEIEVALAHDVQVIPALVGGASMPAARDLPTSLAPMTLQNALALTDQHWTRDVETLVGALRREHGQPRPRRRLALWISGAVVTLVLIGLAVALAEGAFTSSSGVVASVLPRDVKQSRDCTSQTLPTNVGIKSYVHCTVPGLPGASLSAGVFDSLHVGLNVTNETYKYDATKAEKGCPPAASALEGIEDLPEPAGGVLECLTSPVAPPIYIFTNPAKNAVLVVEAGPSTKTSALNSWFREFAR